MKKTLAIKEIIAFLLVLALMLGVVGCKPSGEPDNGGNNGGIGDSNDSGNGDSDNSNTSVDKTALAAELAKEITAQGDYTSDSYNAYSARLAEAKQVYSSSSATQDEVDSATAALTVARLALVVSSDTDSSTDYVPDDNVDTDW